MNTFYNEKLLCKLGLHGFFSLRDTCHPRNRKISDQSSHFLSPDFLSYQICQTLLMNLFSSAISWPFLDTSCGVSLHQYKPF